MRFRDKGNGLKQGGEAGRIPWRIIKHFHAFIRAGGFGIYIGHHVPTFFTHAAVQLGLKNFLRQNKKAGMVALLINENRFI